jgi:hypothetical protein
MVTSEERMKILKMINDGKISADEGAKLLSALTKEGNKPKPGTKSPLESQWLRVRVTDMKTGKAKVNVNLPLKLLDAGLNIAAKYAPEMGDDQMMETVREALTENIQGKIVDVVDEVDQEHVEIFIE